MVDTLGPTLSHGAELDRTGGYARGAPVVAYLPIDTVGQDLFKARQRRGRELGEVSLRLKIRPDHLIAIEENRFDALPGRVYAIGFVRSYAAYLGLDAELFVDRLKAELAARSAAETPAFEPPPVPERKVPQGGAVVAGLLLVALIYSGYYVIASAGRASEPSVRPVPARLAAEAGITPSPVDVLPPAPIERPVPASPPAPVLPVPAAISVTPAVAGPAGPPPRIRATLPAGRRYGAQNRNSRITLRVHRPTHVAVRGARNRAFIDRALVPGDTYRVPNLVGLRLTATDAGAVEVILDGSSVGFVGQDGSAASALSLNPQNIVDRQQG
jgi:cytoskeleton protein RodZ